MPKDHPTVSDNRIALSRGDRLRNFVKGVVADVTVDEQQSGPWRRKMQYFWRRRMAQEFRNPTWPWVDSSDIVMPLIDMVVDKVKPAFTNIVFGQQQIVKMLPIRPDQVVQSRKSQLFFNWFLQYKCEDLFEEVELGVDRLLQYGHCLYKVVWEHRTSMKRVTIIRDELPERYKKATVVEGITAEQADFITQMTNGQRIPLTKEEFDRIADQIQKMVQFDWDLDPDEQSDMVAIKKIMRFLREPKRSGNKVVIKKRQVEYSWPKLKSVHPLNFVVAQNTKRLQDADVVTEKLYFTADQLKRVAHDEGWSQEALRMILKGGKGSAKPEITMRDILGGDAEFTDLLDVNDDRIEIWQSYVFYDLKDEGMMTRCVITYSPFMPNAILDASELQFDNGMLPFVKVDFERIGEGFYDSRGIPEKIDDLDVEITAQHRFKLNSMMISNAPTFKFRVGSELNPNKIRFTPGEFVPVITMNDIMPLEVPNKDVSMDREEQILRTWAEQYIGGTDFGLSGPNSLQDPRTAQEIRAIEHNRQQILSTRVRAFAIAMTKVWDMMWDLIQQYPREDLYIATTGTEPVKVTQAEIACDYQIIPTGAVGFHDPVFESQKALARLQVLMQVGDSIAGDPHYEFNLGEAVLSYLEKEDIVEAGLIMRRRDPEEVQAIMQQQQQLDMIAQQVNRNIPVDPDELMIYLNQKEKMLPFGKAQRIKTPSQRLGANGSTNVQA